MATTVGNEDNINDLVKALLNLEQDAMEAYEEIVERLENKTYAEKVESFRQDHIRHIEELTQVASGLGDEKPDGSMKSILTAGKVVLADIMGDEAILKAMKTNEDDTVTAYDRAVKNDCCTPALQAICEQALADERTHRDWMRDTAERLDKAA